MNRFMSLALFLGALSLSSQSALADVIWTVDSSQSYLTLAIPNQPAKTPDGTPTGNLFVTRQGGGAWNVGNKAPISGTLSTDFTNGSSIRFRAGEHQLAADNSGNYAPDFDNWDSNTETFVPGNDTEPAAFGGQFNTTQTGLALIVFSDIYRFALQDVAYDLGSGVIPLTLNQFSASATTFGMTDAMLGMRGRAGGITPEIPSYFGTASDLDFAVAGTNAAATATITAQPGLYTLMLPISVPITWSVFGNDFTGTAQGVIVATAVPEPNALILGVAGVVLLAALRFVRRPA